MRKFTIGTAIGCALAVGLAVILAGCGSPALQPAPQQSAFTGFATLGTSGTFEWTAAPAWTRLAQLRHNAARALNKKQISVVNAKAIQARADQARAFLEDAAATDARGDRNKANDTLRWAVAAIESAELSLKEKP